MLELRNIPVENQPSPLTTLHVTLSRLQVAVHMVHLTQISCALIWLSVDLGGRLRESSIAVRTMTLLALSFPHEFHLACSMVEMFTPPFPAGASSIIDARFPFRSQTPAARDGQHQAICLLDRRYNMPPQADDLEPRLLQPPATGQDVKS